MIEPARPTVLLGDRLRSMGVRDTARALALLEEVRNRFPWTDAAWEAVLAAGEFAPDPQLYILNLCKLCDAVPPGDLEAACARPEAGSVLGPLLGASEFLPEQMARRPELFAFVFRDGAYASRLSPEGLAAEARDLADRVRSEEAIKGALRNLKYREMARIAVRDLARLSPLSEVTEDLSALASAALEGAIRFARRDLSARYGAPLVESTDGFPRECGFVVMGMGKLGAGELNFSSDIDLLYLYETDRGMTVGGRDGKDITLHQYFVRLAEVVTRIISEATEDGFVFRVDLRLRPEGTKGDLVNSLRSAEIYYESWGQAWERAALIKARPVAGDLAVGEEFLRTVTPFVYRKYLDFTSIEEIKEMKDRVNLAAARSLNRGRDVKLGVGGIREIEFFAQAQQLIYGGKTPWLRLRGTVPALKVLSRLGIVPDAERAILEDAYVFLRSLEHRIQVFQERQTQILPDGEADRSRLARAMGFSTPAALLADLDRHTEGVRSIYGRLFGGAPQDAEAEVPPDVPVVLFQEPDAEELSARLSAMGFSDPEEARKNLAALREGPPFVRLPAKARRYLGKIAPLILSSVLRTPDPDMALRHVERFLAAIGGRTMFYALLFENRKVIDALVRLFGGSPFLSGYLLRHPELLDTFLRHDLSAIVKSKSGMRKELGEILAACDDLEQEMDELRRFKNLETLRIGIHDMAGNLSLEEGMFQLSALAEILLSYALFLARREVTRKFGLPIVAEGEATGEEASFCVLGMGKLGGEELSYHSDLDILFLYAGGGETVPAPGADASEFRKITNHEYFGKVAQRLISILTTVTREGYVYKLDTRLRPSGNAGPLVSSLDSFERYHEKAAQLWERQALLKSRFVAGDRDFGKTVEGRVTEFIYERPLPQNAAEEIHRLRRRMEVELGRERSDRLNLKVGRGGMVDVEFAAQYLQLLHGSTHPPLRVRSTLRALYELHLAGYLRKEAFDMLDEGYRFLRALEVRLRLSHDASIEQFDPSVVSPDLRERYRKETDRIRNVYLGVLGLAD